MPFFVRISRYWGWRLKFSENSCGRAVSRVVSKLGSFVGVGGLVISLELFGCGTLGYFLGNFETLRKKKFCSANLAVGNA